LGRVDAGYVKDDYLYATELNKLIADYLSQTDTTTQNIVSSLEQTAGKHIEHGSHVYPFKYKVEKEDSTYVALTDRGKREATNSDLVDLIETTCLPNMPDGGEIKLGVMPENDAGIITSQLDILVPNVTLKGSGQVGRATFLKVDPSFTPDTDYAISFGNTTYQANYGALKDFWISGNKAEVTCGGIHLWNCYDIGIHNVSCMEFDLHGIWISGFGHLLRNVYSEIHDKSGVYLGDAFEITFFHCDFYGNNYNGVSILGSSKDLWFLNCRIERNLQDGMNIWASSSTRPRNIQVLGGMIYGNNFNGIHGRGVVGSVFKPAVIVNSSQGTANTYDDIYFESYSGRHCCGNIISSHIIYDPKRPLTTRQRYGVREADANQDYNIVHDSIVAGQQTGRISLQGANSLNSDNIEVADWYTITGET